MCGMRCHVLSDIIQGQIQEVQREDEAVCNLIFPEPWRHHCSCTRPEKPGDHAGHINTYSPVHTRQKGSDNGYDPNRRDKAICQKEVYSKTRHHQALWSNMGTVLARTTYRIGRRYILFYTFFDMWLTLAVHEDQVMYIWYQPHILWVLFFSYGHEGNFLLITRAR